jgi:hypothetical protein
MTISKPAARVYSEAGRGSRRGCRAQARPPPGRPRWLAWLTLAVSLLILVAGMLLPHSPVLATGLVLAGLSGESLDERHHRPDGGW